MQSNIVTRSLVAAAVGGAVALYAPVGVTPAADVQTNAFQNGEAGFVVSHFAYALAKDAARPAPARMG